MDWMLKRQGNKLVLRGKDGLPLKDEDGKPRAVVVPKDASPATWRAKLRRLTKDGDLLDEILLSLAGGAAYQAQLPDGRVSDPIVPSPEVRRAAAVDLLHMLRGKPVPQTEVTKSEEESEKMKRMSAYSDEALIEAARPFLEVVARKSPLDSGETKDETAGE